MLDSLSSKVRVNWTYVAAHTGEEGNECADRLAKEGAMMKRPDEPALSLVPFM